MYRVTSPLARRPDQHYVIFFCNDPATTEIYTLSLHDALPISSVDLPAPLSPISPSTSPRFRCVETSRSEEHTSELHSRVGISYAGFCLKKKKADSHACSSLVPRVAWWYRTTHNHQ